MKFWASGSPRAGPCRKFLEGRVVFSGGHGGLGLKLIAGASTDGDDQHKDAQGEEGDPME